MFQIRKSSIFVNVAQSNAEEKRDVNITVFKSIETNRR